MRTDAYRPARALVRDDRTIPPYYESSDAEAELPERLPVRGMDARHALAVIEDQHYLDFSERLNTASYVTVVFEPEEQEAAALGMKVNLADQTVYPQSYEIHDRCVQMIGKLWHAPNEASGAGTVGSTEACLLAGLALKFRWRQWYARTRGEAKKMPNMVISTMFQACWEKFFRYLDVEPRFVAPSVEGCEADGRGWRLDASRLDAVVDDHTIGVVCIQGNHYSGHYDRVDEIDTALQKINLDRGLQVGIHVDAASGGFVAPFQSNIPPWDFRLPTVLSISASGHKFGQSLCGTGWVVWRQRGDLAEHVAVSVSYLGGTCDSYTLNFSRPAAGIYVQFYKFLRLGFEGYARVVKNMTGIAAHIRRGLQDMKTQDDKPYFQILDAADGDACLPVVTARLHPDLALPFDDIDLQHAIAQERWYVSGYKMTFQHPLTHQVLALFHDQDDLEATLFRIVVKSNLTRPMADHLLTSVRCALSYLEDHHDGFKKKHRYTIFHHGAKAC